MVNQIPINLEQRKLIQTFPENPHCYTESRRLYNDRFAVFSTIGREKNYSVSGYTRFLQNL